MESAMIIGVVLGFISILLGAILIVYSTIDIIVTSVWYHRHKKRKKK